MTLWNEMTALEQAAVIFNDMFKSAYGFRPSRDMGPTTLEEYDTEMDRLGDIIADNEREKAERQADALAAVEGELAALMADHGIDRATALRWWFAAEGFEGVTDWHASDRQNAEHVLWKRDIPYTLWDSMLDEFLPHQQAA